MLNAKVSRLLLELLLLWLHFCISVADKKAEEWGTWGACAVTCGTGQRTRVGCTKKLKPGKNCPPGHVTTQTQMCSTAFCSPSAYSSQAQLSPDDITSGIITSSVTTLLSSSASFSSLLILTSSSLRKTSSLGFASSTRMMTSSSESAVVMPSTQFNQVSVKRTTTSTQTSRVTGEAMPRISSLPVASSSSSIFTVQSSPGVKASNIMTSSIITSLSSAPYPSSMRILTSSSPRGTSSFVLESSAPILISSFVSVVSIPSTHIYHVPLKSTTTSSAKSSVAETSSSLALLSSSPTMTSSVVSSSLHAKYSSPLLSSAVMMTSSSSSLIRMAPSKSSRMILKSTASLRSTSSRNDTNKDDSSSRQAYFNNWKENWILQNHVIKDIWTSSEITCAMMCLREKDCQSVNFKSKTKDPRQNKNANTRKDPNCQLNSAKHLAHPRDFFPKKGYRYYYLI